MIRLKKLRCSFCRKDEKQVSKLVAGPHVYICDQCVTIASQIMKDSRDDTQPPAVERSAWRKLVARTQRIFRNRGSQLLGWSRNWTFSGSNGATS